LRRLFVDANILIHIIISKEHRLLEYLVGAEPYTSTNVLEETAYKLIALSIIEKEGVMSAYRVRKLFEKGIAGNAIKASPSQQDSEEVKRDSSNPQRL